MATKKPIEENNAPASAKDAAGGDYVDRLVRLDSHRYRVEKIEAYNVAIEGLRMHQSADPDPDGLDKMLREKLADKLDREIQKWADSLPNASDH